MKWTQAVCQTEYILFKQAHKANKFQQRDVVQRLVDVCKLLLFIHWGRWESLRARHTENTSIIDIKFDADAQNKLKCNLHSNIDICLRFETSCSFLWNSRKSKNIWKLCMKSFLPCCKSFIFQLATCIEFAFMRPQAELSTRPWHLSNLICLPLSLSVPSALYFLYLCTHATHMQILYDSKLHLFSIATKCFSFWTFCPRSSRLTSPQFKCLKGSIFLD